MMTQQLGFSVLTAPLAAIDRRALSQAWYSALHLAHDAGSPTTNEHAERPAKLATEHLAPIDEHAPKRRPGRCSAVAVRQHRETHAPRDVHTEPERRARRSPLARKIEQTFLHPARRIDRATFAIEGTNARVHVTLRTVGTSVRLIAVCPPSVRSSVARALEEARYALAARGIALDLAMQGA